MNTIEVISPFDAHLHLRSGLMAKLVTPMSARQFSDVIVMPNLQPPITTVQEALGYRNELLSYNGFCNYHMALYLTEATDIREVQRASLNSNIIGFKLYPLNATTGSSSGISDIKNVYHLFEEMERKNVPLLIHGEVTRSEVDIFDRESIFILEILSKLTAEFPNLRITLEHITTSDAVEFVKEADENVVASITAHHLLINRNAIFKVKESTALNPQNFCLPIAKSELNRLALIEAATSGNKKFFCGTDSAPHTLGNKQLCGCAGCYTGLHALELYATAFSSVDKIDMLEDFLSIFGRNHYKLDIPRSKIEINKEEYIIPEQIILPMKEGVLTDNNEKLIPFWAGETLNWKLLEK